MKSLHEYLIQEKLKLDNDIKVTPTYIKVSLPSFVAIDKNRDYTVPWKTFEFPNKKYVIYLDQYRGNSAHFANLGDFILQFMWCQDDYENFNPQKDILYSSDDFEEAVNWYFKWLNIDKDIYYDLYKNHKVSVEELEDELDDTKARDTSDSITGFFIPIILNEFDIKNHDSYGGDFDPEADFTTWLKKYI